MGVSKRGAPLSKTQQFTEGLAAVDEAIGLAERTGEMYSTAELYRIRGRLLVMRATGIDPAVSLHKEPVEIADANLSLTQSLDLARQQQTKSWELRAVATMVSVNHTQAPGQEAKQMLGNTYTWFTEGHETADLQRARTVLGLAS